MKSKFRRICLKLLLQTTLTSSLSFYLYQKDERALPGYLLTKFSPPPPQDIKRLWFLPRPKIFSLLVLLHCLSRVSVSLQLQKVKRASLKRIVRGKALPLRTVAAQGEGRYSSLLIYDLGIRWGEWLASRPGRALPPEKDLPGILWIGG
jgi:hypothetical protein